ncbi:MAG: aminoacyl-histidine dipeptidase [Bacteroidetes bacterium]|nr:MAG: aminoacyl-histidine dipeptidase [Bacteroidota bacterium]
MSEAITALEPQALWGHFADLNAVPRPSKHEERVIQFMVDFGKSLDLPVQVDEVGNVIIKKPATPGMENRQTVVLQSHLDMVHQQNAGTGFDFATEGIRMRVDGDWVKAEGTTLGADNGIGVAAIMTILASKDIPHPAIEALFTIDEETGMTGAQGLKGGLLEGSILLNLDTEDDDELTIGCAGGIDVSVRGRYQVEACPAGMIGLDLAVKGLTGGHSGMDIHKGRGNANKLMNRLLLGLVQDFGARISRIDGGGLRNAIPRESHALVALPNETFAEAQNWLDQQQEVLSAEYQTTDPDLTVARTMVDVPMSLLAKDFQSQLLRAIYACPSGIYRLSPDIPGLVQTSNNLARVLVADGQYEVLCLTRSSVDSEKLDLAATIESAFVLIGAEVEMNGDYPGWTPKPHAPIIETMATLYRELFGEEPKVAACHAGLECGILGTNYPGMDMISFGPNIRGAHSPDEKVQVSSVQKFWRYLLETLARVPEK